MIKAILIAYFPILLNNKNMEKFTKDETTFDDSDLLEPLSFYKNKLRDAFHENGEEYFKKLTERAQTDVEGNKEACKKYYAETAKISTLNKDLGKKKGLKGFYIFLMVMCVIAAIVSIVLKFVVANFPLAVVIVVPIAMVGAFVGLIFAVKAVKKVIKNLNEVIAKHQKAADGYKSQAEQTMASLNALFESNMAVPLMSKTTPVVDLDKEFDPEKYSYLHEKYGYETSASIDESVLFVQSGNILGNPFIIEKTYNQSMHDHTYTGTLTITWTERVSDGKGGYRTVVRTQVLTAHVTAPEPGYYVRTTLIYGNGAAPNLSFSRSPTGHGNDDDKKLEKYVRDFDKDLDKKVAKDLKKGNAGFTRLHNEQFEALFDALDRDNETEFRLLFTPLAQKNMVNLIRDQEHVGYGDDFSFRKRKELNYIGSGHLQGSKYLDFGPENLRHFDYEVCHKNFINYCDNYCKEIYFALAPLVAIPLYQQYKTREYIYDGKFGHNVTTAEAEAAANNHDWKLFKHPATRSLGIILKSKFNKKNDTVDECTITAHSFQGIDRVTYVSVYGGDGRYHQVPVHWIEYSRIQKDTPFAIGRAKESEYPEFSASYSGGSYKELLSRYQISDTVLYKKGLFSFVKKD